METPPQGKLQISVDKLRKTVEGHKKHLQRREDSKRNLRWSQKWFAYCTKYANFDPRQECQVSDFPQLATNLTYEHLNQKIDSIFDDFVRNKEKHVRLLEKVATLAGLYEEIIRQLTRREFRLLVCLELARGAVLVCLILSFFFTTFSEIQAITDWKEMAWKSSVFTVALLAYKICLTLSYRAEETLKIVVRRSLKILIYRKLFECNRQFLEGADNNFIHLILY